MSLKIRNNLTAGRSEYVTKRYKKSHDAKEEEKTASW